MSHPGSGWSGDDIIAAIDVISTTVEFQYTPKYGRWLNMVEIELSVLSRQYLARQIPDQENLKSEIAAWEKCPNESGNKIEGQFTTQDARMNLYPSFQD
jgi:DDE superfamily endonuclease